MSNAWAAIPSAIVRCGALSPSSLPSRSSSSSASPRITRTSDPYVRACNPQNVDSPPAVPAPPRNPYRSISSVEHPARAAAEAAMIPAGPPPTTTTSNSPYTGVVRLGSMIVSPLKKLSSLLLPDLGHRRRAADRAERLDDRRHPRVGRARDDDLHVVGRPKDRNRRVEGGGRRLGERVRGVRGQPPAGALGDRLLARRRQ